MWVKTEILMKAERIYGAVERYDRPAEDRNPNISVHIARTDMNTFLPPNYIEDIKIGKPEHWINFTVQYKPFEFGESLTA